MPFLLVEILNFQGSTHRIGVGSYSKYIYKYITSLIVIYLHTIYYSAFSLYISVIYFVFFYYIYIHFFRFAQAQNVMKMVA